MLTRPCWINIDLDQYIKNISIVKEGITDGTMLMDVLKDDAYGCGAVHLAKIAWDEGITNFAVSNVPEALELREALPEAEILVLGYTTLDMLKIGIQKNIGFSIWNLETAKQLEKLGKEYEKTVKIHFILDTGLSRLGFLPIEKSLDHMKSISEMKYIKIQGIFSHFARTETEDDEFSMGQLEEFTRFVESMKKRKTPTGIVHISDSAAIVKFRNADLDLVRCGALLIGSMTGKHIVKDDNNFNTKSILSLYSQVARVEEFPSGRSVSYDITYVADHPIKVATIPVGYGDGIPSQLSGNMEVLISGKRCKQIGAINMDMLMVDASGVSCKEGDEVVLLGIQGDDEITLDDWSAWGGKSSTFFLSMLRDRIPHFYFKDGQVIK